MSMFERDEYKWRETYFVLFESSRRPSLKRIEKMLKTAKAMEESKELAGKLLPLPRGRFARDTAAFATRTTTTEGGAQ